LDLDSRPHCEFPSPASADQLVPIDIAELTRKLARGDGEAYRIFHGAYIDRLTRYLLVVTSGDENATREALQGMLVRLVRYVRVFPNEDVFWSWLTVLARSSLLDERRKRRRYLAFLDRFTFQSRLDREGATNPSPRDRFAELLAVKVSELPEQERQLIERKYFEHMSVRAIAEQMSTTEKAVESSLSRVRRKLKDSILSEVKNEPRP
jgi:RNA polymerase sigma-70 factor (ECF subfamily)